MLRVCLYSDRRRPQRRKQPHTRIHTHTLARSHPLLNAACQEQLCNYETEPNKEVMARRALRLLFDRSQKAGTDELEMGSAWFTMHSRGKLLKEPETGFAEVHAAYKNGIRKADSIVLLPLYSHSFFRNALLQGEFGSERKQCREAGIYGATSHILQGSKPKLAIWACLFH